MIHCRLPTGTPSCSLIDGSATLTIVVSMKSRNPARQTSASVSLPRRVHRNEVLVAEVCIRASASAAHRGVYPQDERAEARMDTSVRMRPGHLGQAPAEEASLSVGGRQLERSAIGRGGLAVTVKA